MKFDEVAKREAQRAAVKALRDAPYNLNPKLSTSPAMLVQETPWVNTTTSFNFDFSVNGPALAPGVNNNVKIGMNDLFAVYGIQVLLATGTNPASFVYRAHGVLAADDAVYNSIVSIKTESSTYVDKIPGQYFRDFGSNANEYYGDVGMQLMNPIRIVNGRLGVFTVTIDVLNLTSALVISANTQISMRLHGVYGQVVG